jgi:hypothetical protein
MSQVSPVVGRIVSAAHMSGRTLVLGPLAMTVSSDLIPCRPDVSVQGNDIVLSCTFTEVPPILLRGVQTG